MEGCIFCAIGDGSVPSRIVHRDDDVVAFEDTKPVAPYHVLVIPRRHVASLAEADAALAGKLMAAANRVAREAGHADHGYRVVSNVGADGGQTVGHLHLHVLAGRRFSWPPG